MKNYLLMYRTNQEAMQTLAQRTPEELQANTKRWMDWIGGIAAQNKLTDKGNRLFPSGKVLKPNGVTSDGPYTEIKECIIGYSIIAAASYDEAILLAGGCPVLNSGGNVEIREVSEL